MLLYLAPGHLLRLNARGHSEKVPRNNRQNIGKKKVMDDGPTVALGFHTLFLVILGNRFIVISCIAALS